MSQVELEGCSAAPVSLFEFQALLDKMKSEPVWKLEDRNSMTLYKEEGLRMVLVAMHNGARVKSPQVDGPISIQFIEGYGELMAGGGTFFLKKGTVLTLRAGVAYEVAALEESAFVLTMANGQKPSMEKEREKQGIQ